MSSPSKAAEVASTPKRGGGGGRSTVINSSSSVNSIFDDDGDDGEEEEDDYRAPRVGAELLVSTTPAGAPGGAGAIGGGAAGAVVSAGTPGAAPRGGSRARTNWRTVFRSLCAWACGRAALKAYSFTDYYLKSTHKYAHVLVATQDRPWCDAAGATWHSFETSAVDGLIDDDVTDRALLFGGYVGGAMLSLLLGTTINTADLSTWLWNALIVFLLGFVGVTLPLTVLEASVSAIFVSFSQVPEVLAAVHPIVFHRFERLSEVYAYSRGKIVSAAIGRGRGRELEGVFGDD